ncbi:unnamed protein product [Eruca vesicaria subsp. sativa]|uniref:Mannose-1-phosphate guanyltransferase C-terminal domain-containing protein n=1 Tax=Eruca vesicaria subsp. sativa TaxID=29727 RepID=A0ABC8KAG3_ERUVS|nr:unnamed protein product [Eruca vesicaria subsp. sativa]
MAGRASIPARNSALIVGRDYVVNSLRHFVEHKQHMYEIEVPAAMISLLKARERLLSPLFTSSIHRCLSSNLSYSCEEARGSDVFIHPSAVVHLSVGVSVGPYCTVGSSVKLGNGCKLYPSSHIFGNKELGDSCVLMTLGSCHIAHDCKIGDRNIFANNTLLAGHVIVEDTHTAGATVVHQLCHIGSFAFIGGGSVVSQDVPKYMMVTGERAELRGLNL